MSRFMFRVLIGAAVALSFTCAAHAQPKPPPGKAGQNFENALALCVGCHGIPGYKTAFPAVYHVPKIAGQQPGYLLNALKAYKSGERSHPSMRGITATLTEDDMKKLADHYGAPAK